MCEQDVPSPIDFRVAAEAKKWAAEADQKRPWRGEFFQAIAGQINHNCPGSPNILELGSGPGCLADHILSKCKVGSYTLLDFSPAMHDLARQRLAKHKNLVRYVIRDFKLADWAAGLGDFDVVVTMQAVHEVRHKRHVPALYQQVHNLLRPAGRFLVCDHYFTPGSRRKPEHYMAIDEQSTALEQAEFRGVVPVLDKGEMSLFRARHQ